MLMSLMNVCFNSDYPFDERNCRHINTLLVDVVAMFFSPKCYPKMQEANDSVDP